MQIEARDRTDIRYLNRIGVDFDPGTRGLHVEAYVTDDQFQEILGRGLAMERIPDRAKIYGNWLKETTSGTANPLDDYHNYEELTAFLEQIAADYPDITFLESIGQSVQGRELWAMKISDNPLVEEAEPEFKYIANMHGNETPGREFCLYLIEWLVVNYGVDDRATNIVNNGEIWIVPSMNPDGFELVRRFNANWVDLNRDFPDRITDPVNTTEGREVETVAVMNWSFEHSFVHSANMHAGALVANYPYDSYPNITPDNDLFIDMSLSYSIHNPPMYNSSYFPNGITNGADWYEIFGGMQDWNYVWMGDSEITLEQNDVKWPPASWLPQGWDENRESMLTYLEWIFKGVRGMVFDNDTGEPLSATVTVDDNPHEMYSDPEVGDFYRILLPGTYDVHLSAPGYYALTVEDVVVTDGDATDLGAVQLMPLPDAPLLQFAGQSAGYFTPEDTVQMYVTLSNIGLADAENVVGTLSTDDLHVVILTDSASFGTILAGTEVTSTTPFEFVLVPETPLGYVINFSVGISAVDYEVILQFAVIVGEQRILVWDVDGNQNSGPEIAHSLENLGFTVDYIGTESPPEDAGRYPAAFVCLGVFPSNHALTEADASKLIPILDSGGAIYMEGGDTWYYDFQTDLHGYFGISGVSDGSGLGELSIISGITELFAGISFAYAGDNQWIDHIEPSPEGIWINSTIWQNDNPDFGCGVASAPAGGVWKTVGTSFEFGGIPADLRDSVMARYVDYFEIAPLETMECVAGDVNGDGAHLVDDVLIMVDFMLGNSEFDARQFCAADLTRDNVIDVFDIVLLVKIILDGT